MINLKPIHRAMCDDIRANFEPTGPYDEFQHDCPSDACIKKFGKLPKWRTLKQLREVVAREFGNMDGKFRGSDAIKRCPLRQTLDINRKARH